MRGNRRRSSPSDEKVEAEEFHPLDAELSRSEVPSPKNEYPHGRSQLSSVLCMILSSHSHLHWSFEPAHEIMVLLTEVTSEGLGKPAHLRSLAKAFAVRTHKVWK